MILKGIFIMGIAYVAIAIMLQIAWNLIIRDLPISGITFQEMTADKAFHLAGAILGVVFISWIFEELFKKITSK